MKDGLQITDQTDLKEWNLGGRLFGFVYRKGFGMIKKKCESICQSDKWTQRIFDWQIMDRLSGTKIYLF